IQYALPDWSEAEGKFPYNPNGSIRDIAGICDLSGRVFGLMPHPEGYNHSTNHPDWTRQIEKVKRSGKDIHLSETTAGIRIFVNAVQYIKDR
ncbi:MAG: phosphoribosylformylglycinamidine synthase subunit PurQ, partial [Proteobacteria bacterium]|nr:phosphoribosylformylglycinamidine synthase subunit PurQ [Pseudomonadota bacterium]